MKVTYMSTAIRFDADIEEAMDFIASDSCFKNRTGSRVKKSKAVNGADVPLHYMAKPKSHDYRRESIRRASLDEDVMREVYDLYDYVAAGLCGEA